MRRVKNLFTLIFFSVWGPLAWGDNKGKNIPSVSTYTKSSYTFVPLSDGQGVKPQGEKPKTLLKDQKGTLHSSSQTNHEKLGQLGLTERKNLRELPRLSLLAKKNYVKLIFPIIINPFNGSFL